ncbi:hypothetical protein ACTVCO_02615 [Sanguibacter sp. A247]|uniref:hypothetical protein n=1 Tax=unclassified Sanguibacter TaxID=2645534 RepID=UPI003FD78C75
MTQGSGPARRDLWAEQGLRPGQPAGTSAPRPAPPPPPPPSAPEPLPAAVPAPGPVRSGAQPSAPDAATPDALVRIETEVLGEPHVRRERRHGRSTRIIGAAAALALVGGVAWALTREDDAAPPPAPPFPTTAPPDLDAILASLATSMTPWGDPVAHPIDDATAVDLRRADLPQPEPPTEVALPSAAVLWEATAATLLGTVADEVGVPLDELTDLRVDPVRTSATVAEPSAATTVAVVRRGDLAKKSWRELVSAVPSLSHTVTDGVFLVGIDVADGTPQWTTFLPTDSASPCQLLDAGALMACEGSRLSGNVVTDRLLLVISTASGAPQTTLPRSDECAITDAAQHKGVLYWVGHGPDLSCLGSGGRTLAMWTGASLPTLDVTTDDRVLARSAERTYELTAEGRWRALSGTVEPGPDGTLLRTFARADLPDLGTLTLRETADAHGGAVATPYVTLVTAADDRTIAALPGAAWARPDLVTRSNVATPDALKGRSGVGNWIVSASGVRERLVHAGGARFDAGSPIAVTDAGIAGVWDVTSDGAPAMPPDASTALVVEANGLPRESTPAPAWSYGGGRIELSGAAVLPGAAWGAAPAASTLSTTTTVTVVGADGVTYGFELLALPDDVDPIPRARAPLWLASGGVVIVAPHPGRLTAVG